MPAFKLPDGTLYSPLSRHLRLNCWPLGGLVASFWKALGRPSEDFRRPLMPSLAASGGSWWTKKTRHGKLHPCSQITHKRSSADSDWAPLPKILQTNRCMSLGDETRGACIRQLEDHAPTFLPQHGRKHHIEEKFTKTFSAGAMGCRYANTVEHNINPPPQKCQQIVNPASSANVFGHDPEKRNHTKCKVAKTFAAGKMESWDAKLWKREAVSNSTL